VGDAYITDLSNRVNKVLKKCLFLTT
jgi:hypothetical protein